MNRNEIKGKATALKGKLKQTAGALTKNPRLRAEGAADEVAGNTLVAVGAMKRKVGVAVEAVAKAIKR